MAAVAYGVSDFVGGVASRRVAALRVVIVSYPLSLVIVLIAAPFVSGTLTLNGLIWGAIAGVTSGLAVWWFYLALATGPMSVVSPLTAVLVAGIPVLVGFAFGLVFRCFRVLISLGIALVQRINRIVFASSVEGRPGGFFWLGLRLDFLRHVCLWFGESVTHALKRQRPLCATLDFLLHQLPGAYVFLKRSAHLVHALQAPMQIAGVLAV